MDKLKAHIAKVADGTALTVEESADAFNIIMSGEATPSQIGAFLMGLRVRGETVSEISGAAKTMRSKATSVPIPEDAIDIVGTGGDNTGTYNISTCATFVTAGGGVKIAKHGNRALSSKSGSGDVLTALGVKLDVSPDVISKCVHEAGVGFMFAPAHHAAMRHVMPARVELGTRTIFNLLGPLSNPAGARRLLVGVFSEQWVEPMAHVFNELGNEKVWVVHGSDGLDEITTTGATKVSELADKQVRTFEISPEDVGLETARPEQLKGGEPESNARAIQDVLAGEPGPFRDIVLFNSAAAFVVADKAGDLMEGMTIARESIDSGSAREALQNLIEITNSG
ncbi:MAG: anthranilate phosphoribosyltransferase [Methyloligellaceae bacterium]